MLAARAEPQVPVVHQELGPVVLRRDRVLGGRRREDLERAHPDLVLARVLRVRAHLAGHDERGLLREVAGELERLGAHVARADDGLDDPGSIAELEELDLLAPAPVVEPALERDRLANVISEPLDGNVRCHGPPRGPAR